MIICGKKTTCLTAVLMVTVFMISEAQAVLIDFENFNLNGNMFLNVGSPLSFTNVGGSGINVNIVEGADNRIYDLSLFDSDPFPSASSQALIDWRWPEGRNPAGTTILFDKAVSDFSLQAGDFGGDNDSPITITAYDINDNVIGSDSAPWLYGQYPPFVTLNVDMNGIAKIVYNSGGSYPNSTFIDNLSFTPEPATLGMLTLGGLALLRRRKRKGASNLNRERVRQVISEQ